MAPFLQDVGRTLMIAIKERSGYRDVIKSGTSQQKANDIHEGKWNGLVGKLETREIPEECVIREGKFFSAKFEYEGDQMRGYDVFFHT